VAKILTEAQVHAFQRDGFLSPIRAMSAARARATIASGSSCWRRAYPTSRR
jgi:hypothetical protein